jgi:2-oxoglutarate ferredoxin oxidoreductase subunit gamma
VSIREIRIAGFGGQGVVLSGQIVGQAASIFAGGYSTLTQSYGPEARGGSCAAEVVISDEPIGYPYVRDPAVLIILSQEAYNKYGKSASSDALVIVDPDLVKADPSQTPQPLAVPANRMARELGRVVVANIVSLGFLAAVSDIVTPEALKDSVLSSVPKGTEEFNSKAFDMGYSYALEHARPTGGSDG